MKKKAIILGVLSLSILIGLYFYLNPNQNENEKNQSNKEIVIGYPHLRIALPVIVAYENDYFNEVGLQNVSLKSYITAQPMMDAIISGKIDLGGFCALPITFGAMAKSNQELLFLGGMYEDENHPISELIVKDTINIKSIKDLEGKRIGILPTRAYEVWIQDILKYNNVDLEKVTISYIKPNMQANSLNNGTVDALFTNDPAATIVKSKGIGYKLGSNLVPGTTKFSEFYFGSFNVRRDYYDNSKEDVIKIAKAIDMAIDFINQNPKEANLIMGKINEKTKKPYLPKAFSEIVSYFPDSKFKKVNETMETNLIDLKKYYLEKKILPKDINLNGVQLKY